MGELCRDGWANNYEDGVEIGKIHGIRVGMEKSMETYFTVSHSSLPTPNLHNSGYTHYC